MVFAVKDDYFAKELLVHLAKDVSRENLEYVRAFWVV